MRDRIAIVIIEGPASVRRARWDVPGYANRTARKRSRVITTGRIYPTTRRAPRVLADVRYGDQP